MVADKCQNKFSLVPDEQDAHLKSATTFVVRAEGPDADAQMQVWTPKRFGQFADGRVNGRPPCRRQFFVGALERREFEDFGRHNFSLPDLRSASIRRTVFLKEDSTCPGVTPYSSKGLPEPMK